MASPHPPYPQPGPSSIPHQHPPPPPYAFGGDSPYQYPHQIPPPRLGNGAGRATYPHQGSGSPPAFHPHFQPLYPYQSGPYHSVDRSHHSRPPQSPYQQQHFIGGSPLVHAPSSPLRQGQFIHGTTQRHPPPPFSMSFHPHNHSSPHLPNSPSALPQQLQMPSPISSLQSQTQHDFPSTHIHPDPSLPVPPCEYQRDDPPTLSPIASVPISPTPQPSSPIELYPSPVQVSGGSELSLSGLISSESSLTVRAPELYEVYPDRTDFIKGFSLLSRRPSVTEAVPFTVSSTARPPPSFYESLVISREAKTIPSYPPKENSLSLTPPTDIRLLPDSTGEPHLSPQHSITSSATTITTPETSTAPQTPPPGSPQSSTTSVSLHTKFSSGVMLGVAPSFSEAIIPTHPAADDGDSVKSPPVQEPQASPESTVSQPPAKKTYASLLRPSTNGSPARSGSNGLPTSSVQGFSIPGSALATPAAPHDLHLCQNLVALLTKPNALVGQMPPIRTRGIVNLGNMCFANTVLQVLVYCPPFNRLFTELDKHMHELPKKEKDRMVSTETPLVNATITFLKEFRVLSPLLHSNRSHKGEEEDKGRDSLVPGYIYDALKEKKRFDSMRGGQQEDAEEFLGFYLDTLEEELLSMIRTSSAASFPIVIAPNDEQVDEEKLTDEWLEVGKKNRTVVTRTHKTLDSPISWIFGGKFRTALKVPSARESAVVDPWSRLQLDIQPEYVNTIEDALRNIATPGTVQVTSSSRPGIQVDASQQTLIESLPPILVLHLKRFLYDTTVKDVVKLNKRITFGTEVEIPKEIMSSTRRSRPTKYKLFGVLNHHGGSATGGHYTLDVLHPDPCDNGREGWIRFDDEFVQNVRAEDLPVRDVGDDRSAYLLFYRRVYLSGSGML